MVPPVFLAPVVLVVLPASDVGQGELFGAPPPVGVPACDVFGWRGGVAPVSARKALRGEIRRRGLSQDNAAGRVGLSRPQFVNILQGRFGASPAVADRIRTFLLKDAITVKAAARA